MFQGLSVSRKRLQQGPWAALKLPTKAFLAPSYAKYLSRGKRRRLTFGLRIVELWVFLRLKIWQQIRWTEVQLICLAGFSGLTHPSSRKCTDSQGRSGNGKNIFLLRVLSQVFFPFDNYSQIASFLQLCARLTCTWVSEICTWRAISWWNIWAESFTIALRLVCSCLGLLFSASHQKLILFYPQDFVHIDLIQNI